MSFDKKEYLRKYAHEHKERDNLRHIKFYNKHKALIFKKRDIARLKNMEWYDTLKENTQCEICKAAHPAIIVFHHKDPLTKKFDMSEFDSRSKEMILAEMQKCITLCTNCHNILHYNERKLKKNLRESGT